MGHGVSKKLAAKEAALPQQSTSNDSTKRDSETSPNDRTNDLVDNKGLQCKKNRRHKTCTMSTREAKVAEEALNMETEQFYKHLDNLKNWEAWVDFCGSHTNFNEYV